MSEHAALSVTYPGAKKVLVDRYAEIALFDAEQNLKNLQEGAEINRERKLQMKKALDEQVRLKQAQKLRERDTDSQWSEKDHARIGIWNAEEVKKLSEQQHKESGIRDQRQKQLNELAVMRQRDDAERRVYEYSSLQDIRHEMAKDRAKEVERRKRDEANRLEVATQNEHHKAIVQQHKESEEATMRALEGQWAGELDKQERQRSRLLAQTYARQARQYAASDSMQDILKKKGEEDHRRAVEQERVIAEAATAKDAAAKAKRAALQRECLDVLAIQVREKEIRSQAESKRTADIAAHAKHQMCHAEEAEKQAKAAAKARNMEYTQELKNQMQRARERKTLEPFLLSKPEREMNKNLLSRLS